MSGVGGYANQQLPILDNRSTGTVSQECESSLGERSTFSSRNVIIPSPELKNDGTEKSINDVCDFLKNCSFDTKMRISIACIKNVINLYMPKKYEYEECSDTNSNGEYLMASADDCIHFAISNGEFRYMLVVSETDATYSKENWY